MGLWESELAQTTDRVGGLACRLGEEQARKEEGELEPRAWGRQAKQGERTQGPCRNEAEASASHLPVDLILVALGVRRCVQVGQPEQES